MPADPLAWMEDGLSQLSRHRLRRQLSMRDGAQGAKIRIDGTEYLNFGSNDYLGLAGDHRLASVIAGSVASLGWGGGASPLISGRATLHARLEKALAEFEATEAALLFSSGYAANVGTIASLVRRGDIVYSDSRNHASIIDGCRLSRARIEIYPHNDVDALNGLLNESSDFERRLIVTDGLFSMDGDFAELSRLAQIAEEHCAMLMVDEAHATGVLGEHGRGLSELQGTESGVHVRVGTLSKALGSVGGFVAGSRLLVDWLSNRARSYFFSTAPPEASCAASLESLRIVEQEPQRRRQLLQISSNLRQRLSEQGWRLELSQSQIVPLRTGNVRAALELGDYLRSKGIFVPSIRPPSVPGGGSMLRISVSVCHSKEDIEQLYKAVASSHFDPTSRL